MAPRTPFEAKRRSYMQRPIETRGIRPRFLIVCEGSKTEPNYFTNFRVNKDIIDIDVQGLGLNTIRLVQETIRLKERDRYAQTWCVFDKDDFPAENFLAAISMAEANDIHVAYSNQSFELWYLLHFNYHDTALTRNDYIARLSAHLGHEYQKNSASMYDELWDKQNTAIRNAKTLMMQYSPLHPERDDPSTTVHLLVEQLLRYSR